MQHGSLKREAAAPCAPARRSSMRACCGRACAAFTARSRHAARRSSTARARQRSCPQFATPLQSALKPLVQVVVGLAAARDARISAAPGRAVPCDARRARSRRCDVHVSLQVQKCAVVVFVQCNGNVCWSVIVGARARVLARACVCAAQGLPDEPTQETARPFPSRATTGPGLAREGTRGEPFIKFLRIKLYMHDADSEIETATSMYTTREYSR